MNRSQLRKDFYAVGGAVRDYLLGRDPRDRDWLAVGVSAEDLIAAGFKQVGQHFTVFLDPDTGDEVTLPRGGVGGPDGPGAIVPDLERRDFTLNAMAMSPEGTLIDPLGGEADLYAQRLRLTDPRVLIEDPVRVFRAARFLAELAPWGFTLEADSERLLRAAAAGGLLEGLTAERVWGEAHKALASPDPVAFFAALRGLGALRPWFNELADLTDVPQPREHHPEGDAFRHTLLVLEAAAARSADPAVRFAALCHDLGKGATPIHDWPHHHGHDKLGLPLIDRLCDRLLVPSHHRELARLGARYHHTLHRAFEVRPKTLLDCIQGAGGLRDPEALENLLTVAESDACGRLGHEREPYPQAAFVREACQVVRGITGAQFAVEGRSGEAIGQQLIQARVGAIKRLRARLKPAAELTP